MSDNDVTRDPWWSRLLITGTYLGALAALIAVASTGVEVPTDGPLIEAVRSIAP